MKRTRHSAEQIVSKLREADAMLAAGRSVAQIVQALGVNEPTYARGRNQYGGMKADEARRRKELEVENAQLKREIWRCLKGMSDRLRTTRHNVLHNKTLRVFRH